LGEEVKVAAEEEPVVEEKEGAVEAAAEVQHMSTMH
jgi:hypothetical protein